MNDTIRKCLMRGTAILAFSMITYNASAIISGSPSGGSGSSDEASLKLIAGTAAAEKIIEPGSLESIKTKLFADPTFYTKLETIAVKPTIEQYRGDLNNLNLFINSNMVTTAKLNTAIDAKLSVKFDEYLKNPNTQLVRCAVPPSCADIGFTKTAADCAGKAMLKCPLNQSKVYCGGEETAESNVCVGSLVEKTFNGKKYCCPVFAAAIAPMKNCVLQKTDHTIQGLYEANYVLLKELELAKVDIGEFKKLDYNGLKTFTTYKDKYVALKDISSSNITALKSSVDLVAMDSDLSSVASTADALYSNATCGTALPGGGVCQSPGWGGGILTRP